MCPGQPGQSADLVVPGRGLASEGVVVLGRVIGKTGAALLEDVQACAGVVSLVGMVHAPHLRAAAVEARFEALGVEILPVAAVADEGVVVLCDVLQCAPVRPLGALLGEEVLMDDVNATVDRTAGCNEQLGRVPEEARLGVDDPDIDDECALITLVSVDGGQLNAVLVNLVRGHGIEFSTEVLEGGLVGCEDRDLDESAVWSTDAVLLKGRRFVQGDADLGSVGKTRPRMMRLALVGDDDAVVEEWLVVLLLGSRPGNDGAEMAMNRVDRRVGDAGVIGRLHPAMVTDGSGDLMDAGLVPMIDDQL